MVLIDGVVYPDGSGLKTERDTLPRKKKMHILKKIRKHLGLVDSTCSMSSNLPPLLFHSVCGERVRLSRDGTTARRLHNDRYFSRGIAFSNRPVEVKERIYLKISETTDRWSGGLRVGFTCIDPASMEEKVPELLVPNARRLKGFWARAIPVKHNIQDCVVYFYVSMTGKLVICINGKKKILCDGVNTRIPLWAAVDVYGNCTGVQMIDSNSNIIPEISRMSITEEEEVRRWPIRFNDSRGLAPLPFHKTKGRSVHISDDGCVASRSQSSYEQGYVFTTRPITFGEKIIIQVLKSDVRFSGSLAFGLTSCNPASLRQSDLPDDSDLLLDRPEYWVVTKNVSSSSRTGDEIALCVTPTGEVTISKNGSPPVFLMNVDVTLQLWAFMDIYGSTESIRMFKQINRQMSTYSISSQIHDNRGFSQSMTSAASCQTMMSAASSTMLSSNNIGGSRIINVPASTSAGGTVLVLNLPSTSQNLGSLNGIISASQTLQKPLASSVSSKSLSPWKEGAASECIICYENQIDSVVYTCGHMCMCHDCALKQWRGAGMCPLCRAPIKDVIKPYTP